MTWRPYATGALLALYIILLHAKTISFVTADLGRHLKNGELFFNEGTILRSNFYSYTEPAFPVVTHHWGSGVLFFLIWSISGFAGLSLVYAVLSGLSAFFIFDASRRISNISIATISMLLAIPILTNRIEIRPEIFSYLFFSVYLWIVVMHTKGNISFLRAGVMMTILQLIWVNLHVFFMLGFVVVTASVLIDKKWARILVPLILVSFINPWGIVGLIEPFMILREYGYMVLENQSVFFLIDRFGSGIYWYFCFLAGIYIVVLLGDILIVRKKGIFRYFLYAVGFFMLALSMKYVRSFPLFGLMFSLSVPYTVYCIVQTRPSFEQYVPKILAGTLITILWIGLGFHTPYSPMYGQKFGIGLEKGVNASAEFYRQQDIRGPIFNNYDIGGYLIYHVYPEKVFVDNRPEAYSAKFFKDTYIPAQESEDVWNSLMETHTFNSIYFYRHDMTPWAQPFLLRRIMDDNWIPVYIDNWAIIFVRNDSSNRDVIESYAIPRELFTATKK